MVGYTIIISEIARRKNREKLSDLRLSFRLILTRQINASRLKLKDSFNLFIRLDGRAQK